MLRKFEPMLHLRKPPPPTALHFSGARNAKKTFASSPRPKTSRRWRGYCRFSRPLLCCFHVNLPHVIGEILALPFSVASCGTIVVVSLVLEERTPERRRRPDTATGDTREGETKVKGSFSCSSSFTVSTGRYPDRNRTREAGMEASCSFPFLFSLLRFRGKKVQMTFESETKIWRFGETEAETACAVLSFATYQARQF